MTDLRTKRTQKAITDAFIKLVNQSSFKKVTVSMIAAEAMINRQTFYRHFEDKYQLTNFLLQGFIEEYQDEINQFLSTKSDFQTRLGQLQPIIGKFILERTDFIRVLRSIKFDNFNFETEVSKIYRGFIQQLFNQGEPLTDLQERVITSFFLAALDYVVDHQTFPSKEEIDGIQKIVIRLFN